jgi:hypothetical protein
LVIFVNNMLESVGAAAVAGTTETLGQSQSQSQSQVATELAEGRYARCIIRSELRAVGFFDAVEACEEVPLDTFSDNESLGRLHQLLCGSGSARATAASALGSAAVQASSTVGTVLPTVAGATRRGSMLSRSPSIAKTFFGGSTSAEQAVDPEAGLMAGLCVAAKNRAETASKIADVFGASRTKTRWCEL